MDPLQYERFKSELASGKRAEAAAALKPFIDSFSGLDEKTAWTRWFLENESFGHKIRNELYENVIFPVLLVGFQSSDPWSLLWLARTSQNLYQARSLWGQIGYKTDRGFLLDLFAICPEDAEARRELLAVELARFDFMAHEWPAGILYGMDGATLQECGEILGEVALAKRLDSDSRYTSFLNDFESKVRQYKARLESLPDRQ